MNHSDRVRNHFCPWRPIRFIVDRFRVRLGLDQQREMVCPVIPQYLHGRDINHSQVPMLGGDVLVDYLRHSLHAASTDEERDSWRANVVHSSNR